MIEIPKPYPAETYVDKNDPANAIHPTFRFRLTMVAEAAYRFISDVNQNCKLPKSLHLKTYIALDKAIFELYPGPEEKPIMKIETRYCPACGFFCNGKPCQPCAVKTGTDCESELDVTTSVCKPLKDVLDE